MPRSRFPWLIALPTLFLGTCAQTLEAQHVEDPVIPRGKTLFQIHGASTFAEAFRDPAAPDGLRAFGTPFSIGEIDGSRLPAVASAEARFLALASGGGSGRFHLGATSAQISADEQHLPIRIGYGLTNWLTLGATFPFTRKRVDSHVRYLPEGATVGANPALQGAATVAQFLSGSASALAAARSQVNAFCAEEGESAERCVQGRGLLTATGAFLGAIETAYGEETLFPLQGSELGSLLSQRWESFRSQLADWGGTAPEGLPLASEPLSDGAFREMGLTPRWGESGFPNESPEAFLRLGDVELHAAIRLLSSTRGEEGGIGIRSALVGTVRFPTGNPDSLALVAPLDPPRGVPGVEVRWVTDLLLGSRLGLLGVVEVGRNGSRETPVLSPGPDALFSTLPVRAMADWTPGGHLRASVTPRYLIGRALSIGGGVQMVRREADRYEWSGEGPDPVVEPGEATMRYRALGELRYTAFHPPISDETWFPFELLLRFSQTVGGEGVNDRRIEAGFRVLRGR